MCRMRRYSLHTHLLTDTSQVIGWEELAFCFSRVAIMTYNVLNGTLNPAVNVCASAMDPTHCSGGFCLGSWSF